MCIEKSIPIKKYNDVQTSKMAAACLCFKSDIQYAML